MMLFETSGSKYLMRTMSVFLSIPLLMDSFLAMLMDEILPKDENTSLMASSSTPCTLVITIPWKGFATLTTSTGWGGEEEEEEEEDGGGGSAAAGEEVADDETMSPLSRSI